MSEILINVTKVEEVVTINATPNITQILVNTNTSGGGGIPEAPIDGNLYGRKDATWEQVTASGGIPDAPNNTNAYVRSGLAWIISYTKTAIDTLLNGKFNNPIGNNTQYLDGSGTPTTFPTIPSISGLATETYVDNGLADKVDKVIGKSLILDTEITRLASVTNFDNSGNVTALGTKVDKETGKSLILDTEISRLASMTAIFTTALKTAYDDAVSWISTNGTNVLNHLTRTDNPHSVTKSQVGLSNVDNTSDVNKPVSTAQATADSNVQTFSINRANHIGTQLASTISDFATQVNSLITSALASFKTTNFLDFTSSGQAQINSKVDKTSWVDYSATSTIVGFASFTTKQIYYKRIDTNLIQVKGHLSGTSNGPLLNFTIPFTSANNIQNIGISGIINNNGVQAGPGFSVCSPNSNVVNVFRDYNGLAFAGVGTKTGIFSILIEIQ